MAKTFHPSVLTANDLIEGHSVFLTPLGWSTKITSAVIAKTPEEVEKLNSIGDRFVRDNVVVGPYLVDVATETGTAVPLLRREQIRASGAPTISVGPEADLRIAA